MTNIQNEKIRELRKRIEGLVEATKYCSSNSEEESLNDLILELEEELRKLESE